MRIYVDFICKTNAPGFHLEKHLEDGLHFFSLFPRQMGIMQQFSSLSLENCFCKTGCRYDCTFTSSLLVLGNKTSACESGWKVMCAFSDIFTLVVETSCQGMKKLEFFFFLINGILCSLAFYYFKFPNNDEDKQLESSEYFTGYQALHRSSCPGVSIQFS